MFDFHLHSSLSYDSSESPAEMLKSAEEKGLQEICFTDHYDYRDDKERGHSLFTIEEYNEAYGTVFSEKLLIRKGIECGLTTWNQKELDSFLSEGNFDFVLGSVHYVGVLNPFRENYWDGVSFEEAINTYMTHTLKCVKAHSNYDVLAHLTYVCESRYNPTKKGVSYGDICDITDEILKTIIEKGKGLEVNTSGIDKIGDFLPTLEYVKRFRELGGEIITVGSDAHSQARVGQYTKDAIDMISEVFPYVCTFEERKPIFHKL